MVEDGIAFCPRCRAPQIRVALAGGALPAAIAPDGETLPPASVTDASTRAAIDWPQALPAVMLALLLAAILTTVTFGTLGLGMLVAGALSVVFYRRRRPDANLTVGAGARLGAVSGVLGYTILLASLAAAALLFHAGGQIREKVVNLLQQVAARSPQTQELLEMLKTPEGFAEVMVLGAISLLLACLICSSLGGALSAFLLRRHHRP